MNWVDGVVFSGESALAIEVKSHGFRLETYVTGDVAGSKCDLNNNIVPAVRQLARKLKHGEIFAVAAERPKINKVKRWVPVALLPDVPLILNTPSIRAAVRDCLSHELSEDEWSLVSDYAVLTVQDFETLLMSAGFLDPVDTVRSAMQAVDGADVHNYVLDKYVSVGPPNRGFELDCTYLDDIWTAVSEYIHQQYSSSENDEA